jgi:choline-glycine betaine transporter
VKLAFEIAVIVIVFAVPLAVVAVVFVWGARKDGEADKAVQARLGIRRRTRLGR